MKTKSFLFSLILVAGLIGFNSCKDDDPSPLTQEEANVAIDDSQAQYVAATTEISESQGYKIQDQIDNMYLPFDSYSKSKKMLKNLKVDPEKLKQVTEKLYKQVKSNDLNFNFGFISDVEDIEFSDFAGTWDWSNGEFVKTSSSPTDEIIFNFPYPIENATNNAKLTYYDCTVHSTYGFITGIKGKIEIGGTEVFSFVYDLNYSTSEISSNLNVEFGAFEMISAFSIKETSISESMTLKKDGSLLYKQSAKISFEEKTDDIAITIDAKMTIASLEFRMKITFNYSEIDQLDDPNDYISLSLYTTDGAKVGDFIFVYNSADDYYTLYFVYTSGEQVPMEQIMSLFGDRLEGFYSELFEFIYMLGDYK